MREIVMYECDICGKPYTSKEKALQCEAAGDPVFPKGFELGSKVLVRVEQYRDYEDDEPYELLCYEGVVLDRQCDRSHKPCLLVTHEMFPMAALKAYIKNQTFNQLKSWPMRIAAFQQPGDVLYSTGDLVFKVKTDTLVELLAELYEAPGVEGLFELTPLIYFAKDYLGGRNAKVGEG